MKSQSGFTLIEMVAVIIILAIMAATAMPRFINLSGDARLSALNGMLAAVNSAKTLVKSKWVAANSGNLDTVDLGVGLSISTISYTNGPSELANLGIPALDSTVNQNHGIWAALDNPNGFSSALVAGDSGTTPGGLSGVAIWPAGAAVSQDCYLFYDTSGLATISNLHGTAPNAIGCM